MIIQITGASQRAQANGRDEWQAWYECHKCGDSFAYSNEFCRDEKIAREESETGFDKQQRRYCYRCGYKITDKEVISENDCIASLNFEIDELREKNNRLVEKLQAERSLRENYIKDLKDVFANLSDTERNAMKKIEKYLIERAHND
jgi:FtsZ-binding cell division protein ZapB